MNKPLFFYKCRSCSRRSEQPNQSVCTRFRRRVNPDKDFCSWHEEDEKIAKCHFCGSTENLVHEEFNGQLYTFCDQHYEALHSCQGCLHAQECDFRQDQSEPHIVTQAVQKGGTFLTFQIKNPNLIKKHCTSCHCNYTVEEVPFCVKENAPEESCKNWSIQLALLQ